MVTEDVLSAAGLHAYEISNYAKPKQASKHNLNYWKTGDWLAVGPGAHGRITTDKGRLLLVNRKSPDGWLLDVSKNGHGCELQTIETAYESFEEYWMMGLRLCEGRPLTPPKALGSETLTLNRDWIDVFVQEGWLEMQHSNLRTTLQGRLRLNTILSRLLETQTNVPKVEEV